jgi:putative zinc finger protein
VTDFHPGEPLGEHPTSEEIAAYLGDALTPEARALVEEHLAACRECRQEVTAARRLLRTTRTRKPLVWSVPLAAAAVLAIVLVAKAPRSGSLRDEPFRSEQGSGADAAAIIRILAPAEGDTVATGEVRFTWQAQPSAPLYHFSLMEASGRAVWTGETTDSTLTLPPTVSLDRGRIYFWTVDALGADGRSLTTRNHRFVTRP